MGDPDIAHRRGSESITFTVVRVRNLKGSRGDTVNTSVKVEFGEKNIGESPKVECSPEAPAEFNYNTAIQVSFDDPQSLEDIASKPVLCTITEVLPKEKKKSEEKVIVLGQCSIDLMPLLHGRTKCHLTLPVNPVAFSPLENLSPDVPKPELDVMLSVHEPLLTEAQLKESNLISITVESLYAPPDAFSIGGLQYNYTAVLPLPVSASKENLLVFTNGQIKAGVDKELHDKQKKWPIPAGAVGNSAYIHNTMISADAIENEDGDYKAKEDRDFRHVVQQDKNRITWNMERRSYMDPATCKNFQEKIAKTKYWPVEVFRTQHSTGVKVGKMREDDIYVTYHGVAYLNLAPLIYPGVKRIRGAYKILPFKEQDVLEKCERKVAMAEEAQRVAAGIINRTVSSPYPKGGKGKEEVKKDSRKPGLKKRCSMQGGNSVTPSKKSDMDSVTVQNICIQPGARAFDNTSEGASGSQQYIDYKSYLMIEINLHRPFVPKRQPEELAKRVAEYIPPRPQFAKRTNGAQRAVADFHCQIGVVAKLLLDEFRESYGESLEKSELKKYPEAMEEQRQKLIHHLNSSGKYFAFKEQLKLAVLKIVREKYFRPLNFKNQDQLQHFLSELYVYLVDQMHVGLSHALQIEDQNPNPDPTLDCAQLKHFAREAEANRNFGLASKYYQERIARNKTNPDYWLDYGILCLYVNDLTKAEECFKECVSIDQRHLHGLLLYGVACTMQDKHEAAKIFFETATSLEEKSILAWTMLGLFYDGIGNETGAEMALFEANKLNIHKATNDSRPVEIFLEKKGVEGPHVDADYDTDPHSNTNETAISQPMLEKASNEGSKLQSNDVNSSAPLFMQVVEFLLKVKAMPFTERALAHHLLDPLGGPSVDYYMALARLKLQKELLDESEVALKEVMQSDDQRPDAWEIMGHLKYMLGDIEAARACYERRMTFPGDASEMHCIYLRLASIYLEELKFQEAKDTFLLACKKTPSCVSWLGVGIACYRLREWTESEDALAEANIFNNYDAEVWLYLALVCLRTGRQLEAEHAYKYAIKLNLQDEKLLAELRQVQEEVSFGNPQFQITGKNLINK